MSPRRSWFIACALAISSHAHAGICRSIGPDGSVVFTDKPGPDGTCSSIRAPITAKWTSVDPAVEKAVIGVMGMDDLVQQTEDLCERTLPTSFKKYNSAADGWRQRNTAILTRMRSVASQAFGASELSNIKAAVKGRTQSMMSPITNAPMASKIKWCDDSAEEIASEKMDVYKKDNFAIPLMNYPLQR